MKKNPWTLKAAAILFLVVISGCDSDDNQKQALLTAQTLVPEDKAVAEIYQRTCRNCHTVVATGAPLAGDKAAWAQLISASGKPALVNNVINGKGGMPPFGLCMECNMDEFSKLIDFMAQQ